MGQRLLVDQPVAGEDLDHRERHLGVVGVVPAPSRRAPVDEGLLGGVALECVVVEEQPVAEGVAEREALK